MSVAKFTKVESLFRTTLAAGITSSQTTIVLNTAPGNLTQFPQWLVIEPLSSNYEIIYVPADDGSATLTNVVRGINPNSDADTGDAAYQKAHPANVDVILAPMHRHWNELVDVMDGTDGTGAADFRIGLDTDVDITIYANNADANKPFFRYDASDNKWLISNDGVSTYDITSGGSGLTRGLGVDIVASAITLDVRTGGGLRNNQGTGSQQADVDPTIVARLDTVNTWTALQTFSGGASNTPPGVIFPYAGKTAPTGFLLCDGTAVSRATYAGLAAILLPTLGAVTISLASPGVVTLTGHGMQTGDSLYLTTTGALPTGLSVNTRYWVIRTGVDTFNLATSLANALAGTGINTSVSQSGVHTAFGAAYGIGDGTTTFNVPDMRSGVPVGRDATDAVYFGGLGQTGGEKTHTLTTAELASHTHGIKAYVSTGGSGTAKVQRVDVGTFTEFQANASDSSGSGTAHNNLQPYVTTNFIIKT
jgi:microcystin-dependent protein